MDTLFIDRKGSSLDTEAGRLIIRTPEHRPVNLPLRQIRFIVLSARVELSSTLLLALDREGITLVVTNPRHPDNAMVCGSHRHGNAARRLRQYTWLGDDEKCLAAARGIVAAKLLAQYRALGAHRHRRPDLRRPLTRAMAVVGERWRTLPSAQNLDTLRGVEGAAAAAYFGALTHLVAPSWNFNGRQRRPPPDPVNALLSLTYTLLHGEAVRALLGHGLDPALGALHALDYGRESLACDLAELVRTSAETWVLSLIRGQLLLPAHFLPQHNGQCLLNKEGRAVFYPLYQHQAAQLWRGRCRQLASGWARLIDPKGETTTEPDDDPPQSAD